MSDAITAPAVFVVGTGRCGSTLVSSLLHGHPEILSLSEFFVLFSDMSKRIGRLFPGRAVDAGYFWSLLSEPQDFLATSLRNGVAGQEFTYLRRPVRRFDVQTGIPPILLVSLCLLSNDPEGLYDEIERYVRTFTPARTEIHFQRLILWLQRRLGRSVSVERSGGSIAFAETFAKVFPAAKFIHVVRDGRACAVSMSRHRNFRLVYVQTQLRRMLGYNPFETSGRTGVERLDPGWRALLPEAFSGDVLERLPIPAAFFGGFWSEQLRAGSPAIRKLTPVRLLTVRYEDLISDPERSLQRLISFIGPGLRDDSWVRKSAAAIRPAAEPPWLTLLPGERAALDEACEPGFAVLDGLY